MTIAPPPAGLTRKDRDALDEVIAGRLRVARMSDLSLSRVQAALAALRDHGLGLETINHHIRAIKAFGCWLRTDERTGKHPLPKLGTSNPEADRRRRRRALTPEEASRLVQAAGAARSSGGWPGRTAAWLTGWPSGRDSGPTRCGA